MSFSSSSDSSSMPGLSLKKFVTQDEIDEKKKKRQEEWEKVRKPEDPVECPEEPVDNRCLYDKLEEQRIKKQEEYEEQFAFRNQVKRLDEDEVEFLDFVSERQQDLSREKKKEEAEIISEMKNAQVNRISDSKPDEKKGKPLPQTSTKKSQSALLAGAVKRKGSEETSPNKKARNSASEQQDLRASETKDASSSHTEQSDSENDKDEKDSVNDTSFERVSYSSAVGTNIRGNVARVVAVLPSVLPGIQQYEDSSDSESSSSDSEPDVGLGSRHVYVNKVQQSH